MNLSQGAMHLIGVGGLRIKSRQSIAHLCDGAGAGSTTKTISAVDTGKAIIVARMPGHSVQYGEASVGAKFVDSTTVMIEWSSNKNASSSFYVYFDVIEFEGAKSIQFVAGGAGTITEVDPAKAGFFVASVYGTSNQDMAFYHALASGTSVTKTNAIGTPQTTYAHVFVVETY